MAQQAAQPEQTSTAAGAQFYNLEQYGPLQTLAQAESTLEKAAAAVLAAGGGVLVIPSTAPAAWEPSNRFQQMIRTPPPPAPANQGWGIGPGVTIVDARKHTIYTPPATGIRVRRTFQLQPGDSAPHWQYHPGALMHSRVVGGTGNFSARLTAAVAAGTDQRFYVATLQGVQPNQGLRTQLANGVSGPELVVKTLGYDRERSQSYFTADAPVALPAGTMVLTTTTITGLGITTNAHTENQTFDVMVERHHYSQGDTYLYDGYMNYMGNESAASPEPQPDEDGYITRGPTAIYSATSRSLTNIFRGQIEAANPATGEVRYNNAVNAHTLATGRPLINLNPQKWVTAGHAFVTHPGGSTLNWGGSLRSTDAPWTAAVVGRFFAINEPGEMVPGVQDVRRWWLITGFQERDGVKILNLRRYWWGAKNEGVGISTLYDAANFTTDNNNPRLLRYVIAPGSYVYDVADGVGMGVAESTGGGTRTLRLTPDAGRGTAFDFAPGDAVEQAIGSDPFRPIPFRAWFFDKVPGVFPAAAIDLANYGTVQRNSAIKVGGAARIESTLRVQPEAHVVDGLNITGDAERVFLFRQKNNNRQSIAWNFAGGTRTLGADPATGAVSFNGDINLAANGATGLRGISGTASTPGANLRGIAVPVAAGATSFDVVFPTPEVNPQYALAVQPNWLTERAVTAQTPNGFTVTFSAPAPANARINWLIVR